jgi:hypothetical protein
VPVEGARFAVHVPHASGQIGNPMSDRAIEDKFLANAAAVVGSERARQIAALVWRLETLGDARDLIKLCA